MMQTGVPENEKDGLRIGVVGPCGSGKTTLIRNLKDRFPNLDFHHIAQEHSYVADMWRRLVKPDILIYLDVTYSVATARRGLNWTEAEFAEQIHRLRDARGNANLVVETSALSPSEIADRVCDFFLEFLSAHPRK